MSVAHPETGEVLVTEADWMAAIRGVEAKMWPLFVQRNELQAEYARLFPTAEMPTRRYRSEKQELVSRCPRCRQPIEEA